MKTNQVLFPRLFLFAWGRSLVRLVASRPVAKLLAALLLCLSAASTQAQSGGPDADNDGLPDSLEIAGDVDGDGVANVNDPDADGDGIQDGPEYYEGRDPWSASDLAFEFTVAGDFQGWNQTVNNIPGLIVSNGVLAGTATTVDPQIANAAFRFPGNTVMPIVVRLKASSVGMVQLFWGRVGAEAYAAARRIDLNYSTPNQWQELTFNTITNAEWAGQTITRMRLDPTGVSGATFEIDSIRQRVVSAVNSTVSASPASLPANGVAISLVTVTLRDTLSQPVTNKAVTLASSRGAVDTISVASGRSDANGIVTFAVASTSPGAPVFNATGDGVLLNNNTTVTFTSTSDVSAVNSTVSASPASLPANGVAISLVTVTLRDMLARPVADKAVTLASSRGAADTISAASGPSDASGVVTFTVASTRPGVPVFSATGDGVLLNNTAAITFTNASGAGTALAFEKLGVSIPAGTGGQNYGATIDFDSDGNLDVVITRIVWPATYPPTYATPIALRNIGRGQFRNATETVLGSVQTVHARDFRQADFDGDGRLDVFVADHGTDVSPFPGGQSLLLTQTADGRLRDDTGARLPQISAFTHHATVGDVDGDLDPDIYLANIWGSSQVGPLIYTNDGAGNFATNNSLPEAVLNQQNVYTAALLLDVDGDGDPDLALGGSGGTEANDRLLLNDGHGNFTYAPVDALPPRHGGASWETINIASGDFDGDGWPDLLMVMEKNFYQQPYLQLLLNNDDGTFRDASTNIPQSWPGPFDNNWIPYVRVVDLDGDGDLDFVCHLFYGTPHIFLNNGTGVFASADQLFPSGTPTTVLDLLPGDFDGDGNSDLFMYDGWQGALMRNLQLPRLVSYSASKTNQAIVFPRIGKRNATEGPMTLNATASSGLPVSYQVLSGPATVSGSTLTLKGAGAVTLQATQSGNTAFNPAVPVEQTMMLSAPDLILDNTNAEVTFVGTWAALSSGSAYYGDFRHAATATTPT